MTSWTSVAKSARVVAAAARAGVTVAKKPGNAHSALCARKSSKTLPCTCGATKRTKAGEHALDAKLAAVGVTDYERNVPFLAGRKFEADRLFRATRLVVEFQGFAGGKGFHGGIAKGKADIAKHSLAAAHGWRVLPVTTDTVKSGEAVRLILAALGWTARPLGMP